MQGFKTLTFGAALAILGFLETFKITDWAAYIPDQYEGLLVSAIGFAVVLLRFATTTPVGKKPE